jgi:hypothetical protein
MGGEEPGRGRSWRHESRLGQAAVALVALSAADLFVTYILLFLGGPYYESNPVAQWVFERWDVAGLSVFKFAMVAVVVVLGETIERHRPGLGRVVVIVGCIASAAAAMHGLALLARHG